MKPDALLPGGKLVGYEVHRLIARGGMGEVYEATQFSLGRRVALKVIATQYSQDERLRARFRRENRTAAALDHPNILPIHEAGELPDGRLFMAMRFVDGPDLGRLLAERGPLPLPEAVAILFQVADALDAAHRHGLFHRDVKPANVLLHRTERGWHAYLTDFGLARTTVDASRHTSTGELLGTVDYMAPEQVSGEDVDCRADVHAFGCMLYRCLAGTPPYKRETPVATVVAHANAPIPILSEAVPGLPPALDLVVRRALEKNPEQRASSAGALMRWAAEHGSPPATPAATGGQGLQLPLHPTVPPDDAETAPLREQSVPESDRTTRPSSKVAEPHVQAASSDSELTRTVAPASKSANARSGDPSAPPDADTQASEQAARRPVSRTRHRRLIRAALLLAGFLAAAGAAAVMVLPGASPQTHASVVKVIRVGRGPYGVASGAGHIWVSNSVDDTVTEIDPNTSQPIGTPIAVGITPQALTFAAGHLWVANIGAGTLSEIDPSTRRTVGKPIRVGVYPSGLAYARDLLWVSTLGDDHLTPLTLGNIKVLGTPLQDSRPEAVVFGADRLWVAASGNRSVIAVDPTPGGESPETIPIKASPTALALGLGRVWVAANATRSSSRTNHLIEIDASTKRTIGSPITLGPQAHLEGRPTGPGGELVVSPLPAVTVGFDRVWVTNAARNEVIQIDPDTGKQAGPPISVGRNPSAIAYADGRIWVANAGAGTVSEIEPG